MSTLAEIRAKVRILAKVQSALNIVDNDVDEYINSFYRYDMPQELDLFELRKNISFCTTPYLDVYSNTAGNFNVNLKDFKDLIVSVNNPIYLAGNRIYLTQSQIEFYEMYPKSKSLGIVGSGNGATVAYTLNMSNSILRRSVVIGSRDGDGNALIITDEPNTDDFGREAITGNLLNQANVNSGTINYQTGAIVINFAVAPADGEPITYELETFGTSIPDTILFFNNQFILRPVPNKVYEVKIQVDQVPDLLVNDADEPIVNQWSQLIAYGAAIKLLQDYGDIEAAQTLSYEYDNQLTLVTRRTSKIRAKETAKTIYNSKMVKGWWYSNG